MNRINDRDVELFLVDEFDRGLQAGSWILLLDSFDEIPDVLSSTESDNAVEEYASAIHDFLFAMKASRAIVASREFRGPKTFQVPRFRIVSLTAKQQMDLIQRSGIRPAQQGDVHEGLAVADPELQQMAKNPMFLGLVCEYVRTNHQFPPNTHSAYDSYLEQRLNRDEARIRHRYGVSISLVRRTAEEIAFCMAAVTGLGLSPFHQQLRTALAATGTVSITQLGNVLNALEYTKLGRAPDDITGSADKRFTFAHRRFQEYFATRVALREPNRVSTHDLLTNGRWRETAVTILQTQPPEATAPLLDEAARVLAPMVVEATSTAESGVFNWPSGGLHIMQLLDAGLGRAAEHIPANIRIDAGTLLRTAWERGRRHDRKWATSVALVADRENTIWLLKQAFASGSIFLGGVAYACVSRLQDPPLSLYSGVRSTLLDMAINGQVDEERVALKAQINRLPNPTPLLRVLRLLASARKIDLLLAAITIAAVAVSSWTLLFICPVLLPLSLAWFPALLSQRVSLIKREGLPPLVYMEADWVTSLTALCARTLLLGLIATDLAIAIGTGDAVVVIAFSAVAVTGSFYFVLWPAAVRHACQHECATKVYCWPLAPVFLIMHNIRSMISLISHRKGILSIILSLVTIAAIVFSGNRYVIPFLNRHHNSIALIAAFSFLGLLALVVYGGAIWTFIRNRNHDKKIINKLISEGNKLNPHTILDSFSNIEMMRSANSILELACKVDPAKSPAVMYMLSDLSAAIEAVKQTRDASSAGLSSEIDEWISNHSKLMRALSRAIRDTTLDKIARTIEQAELTQQIQTAE